MAPISPMITIVGETASGKSDLALELAEKFDGEIICADALTVRKGVDIGTAKPTVEDRTRVPHHLLDVAEPCADFTASVFKDMAVRVIDDIRARGKLPILSGGTGLYIDSVLYDYSFLPAGDRETRKDLEAKNVNELLEIANKKKFDTNKIDTRNKRRLIRLLETKGAHPTSRPLRENTLILGVNLPREALKQRIETRTQRMIEQGLKREVKSLADKYGWQCEALKSIGYREWRSYFEGRQTLAETKEKIIKSTLNLAKKQRTWFKRNNSIRWLDDPSSAAELAATFLNK